MRIAFVVGLFPCLSETFILRQIVGLLDAGHDIRIFALSDPREGKVHALVREYKLLSRTRYFPRVPASRFLRIVKGIGLFLLHLPRHPRKVFGCVRVFQFGRDALSLNLLYHNIPFLGQSFDILHCHFGHNGLIGLLVKKIHPRVKLVTTFHGYDMSEFLRIKGPDVYRELFARGDLFLPVSRYWKEKLIAMGCNTERMRVLHMGIRLNRFAFQVRRKPEPGQTTILTLGRLVEKKGHEYVLRALGEVTRKHPGLRYIIAGDGPLRNTLETLADTLGIGGLVHFFGKCDQSEVLELYRRSHLFVLASITSESGDQEGIPVVLLEAQAAGLPVISTMHSGIPEGVADGHSGLLVPEKDVPSLAEAICFLLDNPDKWPEMGRQGRRHVDACFNQDRLNHRLELLFSELLDIRGETV